MNPCLHVQEQVNDKRGIAPLWLKLHQESLPSRRRAHNSLFGTGETRGRDLAGSVWV
jgi:hypothetical protein